MSPPKGWKKPSFPCEFKPELFSLPGEIWKEAVGWERMYRISNLGRVYSLHQTGRLVTGQRSKEGYLHLKARDRGRGKYLRIHRMVLEAFVGPCPAGMEGCHNNGIPFDNRLSNVRWDTKLANGADRTAHRLMRLAGINPAHVREVTA